MGTLYAIGAPASSRYNPVISPQAAGLTMTTKPTKPTRLDGNPYGLTVLPDPPKPPDATRQRPHIARMDQVLRAHFIHRRDVLVSGEGYLCDVAGNARRSPNPDLIVSFDLDIPPGMIESVANGYTISEVGKPPEFVLEVASETTARRDETVKRDTYATLGVSEYWRYDRTGGRYYVATLAGDRLVDAAYQSIPVTSDADGVIRGYSPALGLELHTADRQTVERLSWPITEWELRMGDWQLRFWDPVAEAYVPDLLDALETLAAERAARLAVEEEVRRLRQELGR